MSRTVLVGGAAVIAVMFLIFFFPGRQQQSAMQSTGSTYGRILVDSPEVYTRERMVNDRFRQEAWLLDQLDKVGTQAPSVQGGVHSLKTTTVSARLSGSTERAAPSGDAKPESDATNTPAADQVDQSVANDAASRQQQPTAIEIFRSQQSAIEEVRNAIFENQLDDRHDLGGNTLYRLKFDATVIPGSDTSAWAQITVRFRRTPGEPLAVLEEQRELYENWKSDLQEQVNSRYDQELRKARTDERGIYKIAWVNYWGYEVGESLPVSNLDDWSHFVRNPKCRRMLLLPEVQTVDGQGPLSIQEYNSERYRCLMTGLAENDYCTAQGCETDVIRRDVLRKVVADFGTSLGQKSRKVGAGTPQQRNQEASISTTTSGQRFVAFDAEDGIWIRVKEYTARLLALPEELLDSERDAFHARTSPRMIPAVPEELMDSERDAFHASVKQESSGIYALPEELLDSERDAFHAYWAQDPSKIYVLPEELLDSERDAFHADSGGSESAEEILNIWGRRDCELVPIRVADRVFKICDRELQLLTGRDSNADVGDGILEIDLPIKMDFDGEPFLLDHSKADDERILETWTMCAETDQVRILVADRGFKVCKPELPALTDDDGTTDSANTDPVIIARTVMDFDGQPMLLKAQSKADDATILEIWTKAMDCRLVPIRVAKRSFKICVQHLEGVANHDGMGKNVGAPTEIEADIIEDERDGQPIVAVKLNDKAILDIWAGRLDCDDPGTIRVEDRLYKICDSFLADLSKEKPPAIEAEIIEGERDGQPIVVAVIGFQEFKRKVEKSGHAKLLFSYTVTPRESSQQLASSSRNAVADQFAANTTGGLGGAQVDAGVGRSSRTSEYAQIMERRPVVVGIASHGDPNKKQVAEFGWLIGPKLIAGPDGLIKYRHLPSQNSLAALVSVPSWWQRADIEIETTWLDEDGGPITLENAVPVEYAIALPGDREEITSALLLGGKRPAPIVEKAVPGSILVGEKAKILINGQNLWRSTVVTIGAQTSKRIFVMPNMKGIIAEFNEIDAQATRPAKGSRAELRVWTSEGVDVLQGGIEIIDPMKDIEKDNSPQPDPAQPDGV